MQALDTNEKQQLITELKKIGMLPGGSSLKTKAMTSVKTLMEGKKFLSFMANNGDLYPGAVGDYLEYDVPKGKQGYLRQFGGKRIIIVCVGSGTYRTRQYMAGPIPIDSIARRDV